MTGPVKDAINQLIDLRLVHLVQSRVTLKKGADGLVFEAYMLDTSQYTASKKSSRSKFDRFELENIQ